MFIHALLEECGKFSDDIVVSYGSHFYNGESEDIIHMQELASKYSTVQFVKYNVDVALATSERRGVHKRPTAYWHNLARWVGICALKRHDWVYLIDADEIPEGECVRQWLSDVGRDLNTDCCYKNACYWYFKSPENQATSLEDSVLLIHYKHLTEENIFGDNERDHLIQSCGSKLLRQVKDLSGRVMWHHFSFVRGVDGLRLKLSSWAHTNDMFSNVDVNAFVAYVYRNDEVNDIVHGYSYKKVPNRFNLVV
jgi:hypothetical protein